MEIGHTGTLQVGSSYTFDPAVGDAIENTYEGSEEAIVTLGAQLKAKGFRAHAAPYRGPVWRLTVTIATSTGGQEQPSDVWEWDTDLAQESMWRSPLVLAAAGNDDVLATWKSDFKTHLKNNEEPTKTGFAGKKLELYTLMLRGQEAVEVERIVLRRLRYFSTRFRAPVRMEAVPTIYSHNSLTATFGLPVAIRAQMPPPPVTSPPFTTWGWKKRRDTTRIFPAQQRVEETREWVFAAWSNMTHVFV